MSNPLSSTTSDSDGSIEYVDDPITRYRSLDGQFEHTRVLPAFFTAVLRPNGGFIHCLMPDGSPIPVSHPDGECSPTNLLLVAHQMGLLDRAFKTNWYLASDLLRFFRYHSGFHLADVTNIPGYGEQRPWPLQVYIDSVTFTQRMLKNAGDPVSSVQFPGQINFSRRFEFLLSSDY